MPLFFFRRPDLKAGLWFALMVLVAAGNALTEPWVDTSTTIDALHLALKAQVACQFLLWVCLIWFVAYYTRAARDRVASTLTVVLAVLFAIHLSLPFGILVADITEFYAIDSLWGEQFMFADGPPGWWTNVAYVMLVFLGALALDSYIQLNRHGDRHRAMFLGQSLTVFLGFGGIHGIRIDRSIVNPLILLNYALFGIILLMSSSLADKGMRALMLSKEVTANEQRWGSAFITGQCPFRTGLTKVGLPRGRPVPPQAGPDACRVARAARLCDGAVRQ